MRNRRVGRAGFVYWRWLALSILVGISFWCFRMFSQIAERSPVEENEIKTASPVRRNWSVEYPKLVELGFKEFHPEDNVAGMTSSTQAVVTEPAPDQSNVQDMSTFSIENVRLGDLLGALNIKRDVLDPGSCSPGTGKGSLHYRYVLNEETTIFIQILSLGDTEKDEDGFVSATLITQTEADRIRQMESIQHKGTVDAFDLVLDHFKQKESGEWVREGICVGEVVELFRLKPDSPLHPREEDLPPGVSDRKNHKKKLPSNTCRLRLWGNSEVLMQLPFFARGYTTLKELPAEMKTTVIVPYATPTRLFEVDTSLTLVLLDAGFEHKKGGEFVKRGMDYGLAKVFLRDPPRPAWTTRPSLKWLKPKMEGTTGTSQEYRGVRRTALFVFESQETSPTWSDDSKVDVFVSMSPKIDAFVKTLKRKNP